MRQVIARALVRMAEALGWTELRSTRRMVRVLLYERESEMRQAAREGRRYAYERVAAMVSAHDHLGSVPIDVAQECAEQLLEDARNER